MLRRLFEKKADGGTVPESQKQAGLRLSRHSGGWAAICKRLQAEPGLRVIDAGSTSPTNINYLTSLGHSIFLTDPVADAWSGSWHAGEDHDGNPIWNVKGFLDQTMDFEGRTFDVVLLWTALDYLPEAFVVPLVDHLYSAVNPLGQVLAFFHTKTKGEEARYGRFHITPGDNVEVQLGRDYPIQRAFTNRSIQSLFSRWSGFKQFLAKDSLSEVIITR